MIKKIILLSGLSFLNPAYAESTGYDTATNIMTIPFVQLDNHNFSNVQFICDPTDGYSCKLLRGDASDCASGLYHLDGSDKNIYSIHTRSSGGIQYGGIKSAIHDGLNFSASWVKSPKDQNPYLFGRDLTQFSDNVTYGVVGRASAGSFNFQTGDLITVVGDSTGYSIEKVNSDAAVAFNHGEKISVNNSCNSLTGVYSGNDGQYSKNSKFSVNILNNMDGSIQLLDADGDVFTASWDSSEKLLNKYSIASLGNISSVAYPGFEEDKAFVIDIGNGIALSVINGLTGKITSTAVFIQNQ